MRKPREQSANTFKQAAREVFNLRHEDIYSGKSGVSWDSETAANILHSRSLELGRGANGSARGRMAVIAFVAEQQSDFGLLTDHENVVISMVGTEI